jgi:hypothetical protein
MERQSLTPEEMVFQAAFGHELVHQEKLPVLAAVAQEPDQVRMRQSAQEVDLGLHLGTQEMHMRFTQDDALANQRVLVHNSNEHGHEE